MCDYGAFEGAHLQQYRYKHFVERNPKSSRVVEQNQGHEKRNVGLGHSSNRK
jgi:hypothetical protein